MKDTQMDGVVSEIKEVKNAASIIIRCVQNVS